MSTDERKDWLEEFRGSLHEPTDEELERFRKVIDEAEELRKRTNIAPLTTGELVRAVRDEQDDYA